MKLNFSLLLVVVLLQEMLVEVVEQEDLYTERIIL
jgi:hypothetical protein